MLTLQTLAIYFILGTIGSIMLLKDGYTRHAKFLFVNMTVAPIALILFLILIIGIAPMSLG